MPSTWAWLPSKSLCICRPHSRSLTTSERCSSLIFSCSESPALAKIQGSAYGPQRHYDGFLQKPSARRHFVSCLRAPSGASRPGRPTPNCPASAVLHCGPERARANRFFMRPKGRTASAPASCRPHLYEPICPSCARGRGASTPADPTGAWGASTLRASWIRRLPLMHCLAWGPVSRYGREACASLRVPSALGRCAARPPADACSTGFAGTMPALQGPLLRAIPTARCLEP